MYELLGHAVDDLPVPAGDVVGAVLAEVRVRRRRRRVAYSLGASACVLAVAAGVVLGPGLADTGGSTVRPVTPAAQDSAQAGYYPVGALLPRGVTDLRRIGFLTNTATALPPDVPLPLDTPERGTGYSFSRHGKTGFLTVVTYDPARSRTPESFSTAEDCTTTPGDGVAHDATCKVVPLPGGVTARVTTQGLSGATSWKWPAVNGPGITVTVTYPDKRVVLVADLASQGPAKVTGAPLLTEDEVMRMATSQDWFSPASVN